MKRLMFITAMVAAIAASLSLMPSAAASMHAGCQTPTYPHVFHFRNGSDFVTDLRVDNMTCRQAIKALHNADMLGWPPRLRTTGFHCRMLSGGEGGATDRCVHSRPYKAFRITIYT